MRYHMGLVMSKQKMWFRKASLLASPLMTLLLSSFLVAIAAPAETAELKVAGIDSMKIIEGTNAGKKMNEALKDYIAARQKILDTDADDLKKREEELSVQGSALSAKRGKSERRRHAYN